MQNTFSIRKRLYVYTVCSVYDIFPLVFPRGLAQIEFDLGPRTVRVSMASKRGMPQRDSPYTEEGGKVCETELVFKILR